MVHHPIMPEDNSDSIEHMESRKTIEVIPLLGFPMVECGNDLGKLILNCIATNSFEVKTGDIMVVAHTVVSIAEGNVVHTRDVSVTERAEKISQKTEQKPKKVQVALDEASEVIKADRILITRSRHGIITDMSGVDESNAPLGCYVTLPRDPDESACRLSNALAEKLGFRIPVIIADTQGRPWRRGAANLAIGISAMSPFTRNAGRRDLYGRELRSSLVCIADELASAAELIMGQANEGIPVVLIRGITPPKTIGSAVEILRSRNQDLF